MKRIRLLIIPFSLFLPTLALAATPVVTVSQPTTLVLPTDSSSYTMTGSFDSLTINSDNFSFDLTAGASVLVSSASQKSFAVSGNVGSLVTCTANGSSVNLDNSAGTANVTVTVTPSGSTCGGSSSSGGNGGGISGGSDSPSGNTGGGGGGGGGGSSTPAAQPTTAATTKIQTVAKTSVPAATVAKPSAAAQVVSPVFNKDLSYGSRNTDVKRLQQLLAQDKTIYPSGLANGVFGSATMQAVKNFQKKYGITPVDGRVGPATRAKIQQVFRGSATSAAASATTPSAATSASSASRAAQIKTLQDQMKALQDTLKTLQKK